MAKIRLVPSTYYLSNSSYLSVANAANMYENTDSTSVGTVTNRRTSTTAYYIYLRGFNFDDVPEDAIVSSIKIKLKAYHSGGNTSTIYCYDGTTQVSACGSTTALGTSATVKEFTNTTVDWETLKGYGSDFGIRINCRRASRNTQSVIYIYGAEIEVEYTLPVYHNVSITGEDVDPSGTVSVLEGDSLAIKMYHDAKPMVTDNNVDVTSQVTESSQDTADLIPESSTNSGFTLANIANAYADADSDDYASLELNGGASTGTLYLDFETPSLPSGATILGVACDVTLQYNRNGSSSGYTASCQLYAGNTAKGSSQSIVSAGGTDVAKTKFSLTPGSWTMNELASARLMIAATNNASSTHRFLYVYGATLSVTYSFDGKIFTYTLTNIVADHTIVVTKAVVSTALYVKQNGTWVQVQKAYKKVNGAWVEQSDLTAVFNGQTNYINGG